MPALGYIFVIHSLKSTSSVCSYAQQGSDYPHDQIGNWVDTVYDCRLGSSDLIVCDRYKVKKGQTSLSFAW